MARAVRAVRRRVDEVVVQPVGPVLRNQRIMLRQKHVRGRLNLDGTVGGRFCERLGDHARAGAVPGDRCGEHAGQGVLGGQLLQIVLGEPEIRARPVAPEVAKIFADVVEVAVDEAVGKGNWWKA